ncbi:MAG: heparin/heparin-sulfate lyase HepB [Chryseosolibacter sp.]
MNIYLSFRAVLLWLLAPVCLQGQGQQHPRHVTLTRDTMNSIIEVTYPELTAREGEGLNIPLPPDEHPRLYFRKHDIPALKEKANDPRLKGSWDRIMTSSRMSTDGLLRSDGSAQNLDASIQHAIEAKALLYAFYGDRRTGREAVDALLNFYATLKIDLGRHDICRTVGRTIVTGSVVYDWCYDLLTPAEKQILIGRMETLAVRGLEVQWPQLVQGSVTGHGSEAQLARDMLSCGVATYDEKPEIYNLAAGRIMAEFVPARKFFYPAAYHHQGSSYGGYRFLWDMWATFIFARMGYPDIFGPDQAEVPYRLIYMRRPDGQLIRDGDDFIEGQVPFGEYWQTYSDIFAGSYFGDPVIIGEALKQDRIGKTADYLFDFLFFNTAVSPVPGKHMLPLTRYFKEPLGAMIARTGWEEGLEANTVVAEMKVGVQNFANHQHLDAGSFQVYYKGPLAAESGIYEGGNGAYGSDHFKNYYQRTIAHNSMLVFDPNEQFFWHDQPVINDGGQQYPNRGDETPNLPSFLKNDYKTGEVLAHGLGPDTFKPDYSYLKGELAEAYGQKIKSFTRSFVFLNLHNSKVPAALVVFDRVAASDKNFKKYWLLHSVQEPDISGKAVTISRSEKGYNGKMINTTLLPSSENLEIRKVGGPGNEFSVFGRNFPQTFRNPGRNSMDSAMWRVEISPKKGAAIDYFLNVMQVMELDGSPEALPIEKIATGKFVGTKIGDRIVLFSKDGTLVSEDVKIRISGNGVFKVLLTDMSKGGWRIQKISRAKEIVPFSTDGDHVLYFEATQGEYLVSRSE